MPYVVCLWLSCAGSCTQSHVDAVLQFYDVNAAVSLAHLAELLSSHKEKGRVTLPAYRWRQSFLLGTCVYSGTAPTPRLYNSVFLPLQICSLDLLTQDTPSRVEMKANGHFSGTIPKCLPNLGSLVRNAFVSSIRDMSKLKGTPEP